LAIYNVALLLVIGVPSYAASLLAKWLDGAWGLGSYASPVALAIGIVLLLAGVLVRVWAATTFHRESLRVLYLKPQQRFITSGPYRRSRNPLYVGIVLITLGFMVTAGSTVGLAFAALNFLLWHLEARKEESDLATKFGDEFRRYRESVPLWI
jgi:protein-S-isoprenylcysteine O-methyltransferase Ste14